MTSTVSASLGGVPTLARLQSVTDARSMDDLSLRIGELRAWIAQDLADVEAVLGAIEYGGTPMHRSAAHLMASGGKRLRPLCVALAARMGSGFDRAARDLAAAAELVHNATLLHDDVVDTGDARRGAPTARVLYGNAASIYAGDWLLVEALRRIRAAEIPDLLDRALGVLGEMLDAEGLQLALRGSSDATVADWTRVVEGKTASLFRWCLYAGARAGGLDPRQCSDLERYGHSLGVAFQLIDDVLDLVGDPTVVGKSLHADLREGKLTHPVLVALGRDPSLARVLGRVRDEGANELDPSHGERVMRALRETGALDESRALAKKLSDEAVTALADLPPTRAREALEGIAAAMIHRRK